MSADFKLTTSELLFRSALQMGLEPVWLTARQEAFAITMTSGEERYINRTTSSLNSQAGASLAENKHLTRVVLKRHGLPNIPFIRATSYAQASAFLEMYDTIIAKPVKGCGSSDIHIVTTSAQIQALQLERYILEQYIPGKEMRYLVLNGAVIAVHRSEYGSSVAADRKLERISRPILAWDPQLVALSLQITEVLGLTFTAVDFMVTPEGKAYVLEVNTRPGLKWFHAPSSGPVVNVAHMLLEATLADGPTALRSNRSIPFRA